MDEHGEFVWHDLMSKDPEGSKAFYTGLFGWQVHEHDMGEFTYNMFMEGERGVGGVIALDDGFPAPSHWVAYADVANADDACAKVGELGGTVCIPPHDMGGMGRSAFVEDPTGGFLRIWEFAEEKKAPPQGEGTFCWHELMTNDVAAAKGFYKGVFGWEEEEMDMGPMGVYTLFKRAEGHAGGAMAFPPNVPEGTKPHWMNYVHVADVDAKTALAGELGAQVLVPPSDIPEIGRFSVLMDPQGATIALFQSAQQG